MLDLYKVKLDRAKDIYFNINIRLIYSYVKSQFFLRSKDGNAEQNKSQTRMNLWA